MTISATSRIAGPFTGDGSTTVFPFTFAVFEAADLLVLQLTVATGAIATLALTADYSVTLNADQDTSPGGSIMLTAPLAVGTTLTITTAIAAAQSLDLTNGGAFYPDAINSALDWLTVLVQQLYVLLGRCVQTPLVDSVASPTLPAAAQRAGQLLGFDGAGRLTLFTVAGGGTLSAAQEATGTVNGVNRVFSFAAAGTVPPVALVFVGGVFQTPPPGADYTIAAGSPGTWQITFTVAPLNGPVTVVVFV